MVACATSLAVLAACSSKPADSGSSETAAAPSSTAATTTPADPAAAVDFASLTGDAANGKTVFAKCMACHSLKDGENRIGPSLHGMIGRPAGQVTGFSYSTANKSSGIVWSKDELFKFLESPQKTVPGTKMSFPGLPMAQDRADVIAYLDAND